MIFKQGRELKELEYLNKIQEDKYHELARAMGLSDSGFLVMYCLMELDDQCTQKAICEKYVISKQTVNSSISALEKQGLVKRGEKVGRDVLLHYTKKGEAFAKKYIGPVIALENEAFHKLGEKKSQELLRLMKDFVNIFEETTDTYLSEQHEEH